jgi:hypothetical protein
MVTARYIRLFSEIGCHSIKLPYDPTLTAELIPFFESMLQAILQHVAALFPGEVSSQRKAIRNIFAIIRSQLRNI